MVDSSREAFNRFRKTRKGYLVDEESFFAGWQASRSAAIEECAAACEQEARVRNATGLTWQIDCALALLNTAKSLRTLKGEG
jgi:hypothetical protein